MNEESGMIFEVMPLFLSVFFFYFMLLCSFCILASFIQSLRVCALCDQLLQRVHHILFVFPISNSEPFVRRLQHLNSDLALSLLLIDDFRKQKLGKVMLEFPPAD